MCHLVSRHPIWTNTAPFDILAQWREAWESAFVVNHGLVPDPTIQQPGFDLPCRSWSLLIAFREARDSAMQICLNGVCLHLTYAGVVNPRQ